MEVSQLGERSARSTAMEMDNGEGEMRQERVGEDIVVLDGVGEGLGVMDVATDK